MSKPERVTIRDINLGGIAESPYQGGNNSVADMVGLDLHSVPGLIKAQFKLTKDSDTTINELCKCAIASTDGKRYFFSADSGKIWSESGGSYTLVDTTTPLYGEAKCLGAIEFGGYIYWATQNYLHRIRVTDTGSWSSNSQENWKELHLDYESYPGSAYTYTVATSISETDANKLPLLLTEDVVTAFGVNISDKGTGNITITVHDSSDNSIASKTISNGSLATGFNYFELASDFDVDEEETYHLHITSTVADADIFTSTVDTLQYGDVKVYSRGDDEWHTMKIQNRQLFIADRHYVHTIEVVNNAHVFGNKALTLVKPERIKCLGRSRTDLLIGTYVDDGVNETLLYVWNTWSEAPSALDPIPETGIHAFIEGDNYILAIAGVNGNIYIYQDGALSLAKSIPGEYSSSSYIKVNPNAQATFNMVPLIGISNGAGNPIKNGVYSYGKKRVNYPYMLNFDYPISQRNAGAFVTDNVEIGCILVTGNDLYVAWKDTNSTAVYGVDKLDYSNRLSGAYFTTRQITRGRILRDNVLNCVIAYRSLPEDTDVDVSIDINHSGSFVAWGVDKRNDTDKKIIRYSDARENNTMQVKTVLTCSGSDSPEIEQVLFETD